MANPFDNDVGAAAKQFAASEEFHAIMMYVPPAGGKVLDLGAGTGTASYAFAKAGSDVTAIEPAPSIDLAAVRDLALQEGVKMTVIETAAEKLSFPDESFDVVFVREAFHRARNLPQLCRDVARLLRKGGVFIAIRQPVAGDSRPPTGEGHTVEEYTAAITGSGLKMDRILKRYDSVINFQSEPRQSIWQRSFLRSFAPLPFGASAAWALARALVARRPRWQRALEHKMNDHPEPGNVYSFVARKSATS